MNASARALAAGTFSGHNIRQMVLSGQAIFTAFLLCLLLITAFAIIYVKDSARREFIQFSSLQHQHNEMLMEQSKLLLEQNTWSSPIRIQKIATEQLNMTTPAKNTIVFVR